MDFWRFDGWFSVAGGGLHTRIFAAVQEDPNETTQVITFEDPRSGITSGPIEGKRDKHGWTSALSIHVF
jgi:hypothetical protein